MPKSKTYLLDVNVWLALASQKHVHSPIALAWFEELGAGQAVFCRVTQMSLLRLITNPHVMQGEEVSQAKAWEVYDELRRDFRSRYLAEPAGLEPAWRKRAQPGEPSRYGWTDAYLLAFAEAQSLELVTFDRALIASKSPQVVALGQ